MLYISIVILFVEAFALFYFTLSYLNKSKITIKNRLRQIKNLNYEDQNSINSDSLSERVNSVYYKIISQYLIKITPKSKITLINKKLEKAGFAKNNAEKWLYKKWMMTAVISLIIGVFSFIIEQNLIKSITIVLLLCLVINCFFNFYLSKRITQRKKNILRDLPYIIDLITVSVEAGLSFDGAIARVVNNINGELCDEFMKCLKEIRMGIPRKVALRSLSDRCDVKELSLISTSIIQADELGVSLGNVLRIEASNLREHRKQLTREKAMKVPIKMLFPLILFIFPSIFIIILGPAVIKIFNIFLR